jgi:hypothetical protein
MPRNDFKEKNYSIFKSLWKQVQKHSSGYVDSEIEIDAEIDFADITLNSPDIKTVWTFGPLNMTPVFLTKYKRYRLR